jgi:NAD(P)-dependent dehydrogenase (short-subunit alcohol dehydrogenase family)
MDDRIAHLLDMSGKTALVTGAATGIGEGIARVFAAAGAAVVVADRDGAGAQRVAADIDGTAATVDVLDVAAVESLVESCGAIDVLVNNVGSYHDAGSILDQSHESWHRAIDLNLVSVFNCSKAAATAMVAAGRGGAIVNVASVDGQLPCLGTGYDSAKAAVIHFTRSLALDLAPHGIRVNCINPGHVPVETLARMKRGELPALWPADPSVSGLMGPMMKQRSKHIPIGRSGTPQEMGDAVLFLASPAAAYITGQTLNVDGGWTLV